MHDDCPPCEICGKPAHQRSSFGLIFGWCSGLAVGIALCIAVNRYWSWPS